MGCKVTGQAALVCLMMRLWVQHPLFDCLIVPREGQKELEQSEPANQKMRKEFADQEHALRLLPPTKHFVQANLSCQTEGRKLTHAKISPAPLEPATYSLPIVFSRAPVRRPTSKLRRMNL